MLYSIGKDSSVMLRLAQKAFYPAPIPFPLMHIDTGFKFKEMIEFRDNMAREVGAMLVWRNEPAIAAGTNPIALDTKRCCGLLKHKHCSTACDTTTLMRLLVAQGAMKKNREPRNALFLPRRAGQWDPKNQRPELWNLYNARVIQAKAFEYSRCRTGPRWMCGNTSTKKTFPLSICTLQKSDGAVDWGLGEGA